MHVYNLNTWDVGTEGTKFKVTLNYIPSLRSSRVTGKKKYIIVIHGQPRVVHKNKTKEPRRS